jgi:hypothetical protein
MYKFLGSLPLWRQERVQIAESARRRAHYNTPNK